MKLERIVLPRENRNMAMADPYLLTTGQSQWTDVTIRRAVAEGYGNNGWVYKAVSLIARTAASVPWLVYGEDGKPIAGHPLTAALARPNPEMSRQDTMELLVAWLQLAGSSYLYRLQGGNGATLELWPISPDRLAPVPSADRGKLIDGYHILNEQGVQESRISAEYTPQTVIAFKLLDPASPLNGISPLKAAARAVDTDNAQTDWNKAGMDNRGVFDGVFSFSETLSPDQAKTMTQRIKEKFLGRGNARKPLVLGSNAKYQRVSISPAEMDFINSRKFNREEIMSIFGVPPQLVGSQEASTYNNFAASLRIFWLTTIIPLLDDMADTFSLAFADELPEGTRIGYDISCIEAMRESEDEKAALVKRYWDMGVPMSVLSERFKIGFDPFDGWDKPFSGSKPAPNGPTPSESATQARGAWRLRQNRNPETEFRARDQLAEGPVQGIFLELLRGQRKRLFQALDDGQTDEGAIYALIATDAPAWQEAMEKMATTVAVDGFDGVAVAMDGRALARRRTERRDELGAAAMALIEQYLQVEGWMLTDLSHIQATTVAQIIDQLRNGLQEGQTVQQIKQAIDDVGVFGPERSLMLARTLAGTAASIGQLAGATAAGATEKQWVTAGFEVREHHTAREGERVPIDGRFSDQGYGAPRYPLDPVLEPGDRVNCRCGMLFTG